MTSVAAAACTIVARNYLAQARALIQSWVQHGSGGTFYLFVVDGLPDGLQFDPPAQVLGPDDIPIPGFRDMAFKYDVTELCTAVKPWLLDHILRHLHESAVVYFDPDIVLFRPLPELWDALEGSSAVLTPHLLNPIPLDGKLPNEQIILSSGAYNLGFIALKASDQSSNLLTWWQERLRDHCRVDLANGLFVDQKWIDLVPGLYPETTILTDDTYNVAYWNLHSRRLEKAGEQLLVNGRPLAFFHYSGYNPLKPRELSRHQNRIEVLDGTPLAYLLDLYADRLKRLGFFMSREWPYGFGHFDNGIAISTIQRSMYGRLDPSARARFADPFSARDDHSFFSWSVKQGPNPDDLSPFLDRLLRDRPDLLSVIPDPKGKDRQRFLQWAAGQGSLEMGYHPTLADPGAWSRPRRNGSVTGGNSSAGSRRGVNVCGYLRNETGLGAIARGFIDSLQKTGTPIGLRDVSKLSSNRSEDPRAGDTGRGAPFDINLICVNADQHFAVKAHLGDDFFRNHYNIGVWFWELPTFPAEWRDRFDEYNEVWATSSFIANTLAPISPIPIVRIPPMVTVPSDGSRVAGRAKSGCQQDEFVFLFTFDFASFFQRKNPLGLIEAFRGAFNGSDRARLVIKCVNEKLDLPSFERMKVMADGLPISIHPGYWRWDEMQDLLAACDAYVSLHRSEGLGLTIAEAMGLGKPVIATAWSGNVDFMSPSNSFGVSYELVELQEDVGPYKAGSHWAEPNVAEASKYMRLVYEDRELAATRGAVARNDIERNNSPAAIGERIYERLAVIMSKRSESLTASLEPSLATNHVMSALPPSVPPLDLRRSRHGPIGIAVKRGMSALLQYHSHHQWEINTSFANFMHQLDERLVAQNRELERRLTDYRNELDDRLDEHDQDITLLQRKLSTTDSLELHIRQSDSKFDSRIEEAWTELRHANAAVERLSGCVDELQDLMSARPYMADDVYGALGDPSQPMGFGIDALNASSTHCDAKEFEDLFRGSPEFIAQRQAVYLPFLEGKHDIVDLGCGRGEFLDLLQQNGIEAVGVDLNERLVKAGRARGLNTVVADAFDYLCSRPDGTLDVIFSAQFIEHIESSQLPEFLSLARAKLRPHGLLIAETVNPESYTALKTFHVDLTHQRPIYPQVLLHLCERGNFSSARVFYPLGGGFTQANYMTAGEYAVIAVA